MKILVTAKRVTDPEAKIKVKPDGSGIVTDGIDFKVNPFDEIAIEEAIRIKEKNNAEIVVVGIGAPEATKEIRSGLAMGADRGILVTNDSALDSFGVAAILKKLIDEEKPDLILMGKQSVDSDNNQAAQILAEMLGLPQACFVSKIELSADQKTVSVTREVDGGLDHLELDLPAVITAELRLNEPRYASLPGIMKAKKKVLKEVPLNSLGLDLKPKATWHKLSEPSQRKAGIKVADVPTLVQKLHNEAKII